MEQQNIEIIFYRIKNEKINNDFIYINLIEIWI